MINLPHWADPNNVLYLRTSHKHATKAALMLRTEYADAALAPVTVVTKGMTPSKQTVLRHALLSQLLSAATPTKRGELEVGLGERMIGQDPTEARSWYVPAIAVSIKMGFPESFERWTEKNPVPYNHPLFDTARQAWADGEPWSYSVDEVEALREKWVQQGELLWDPAIGLNLDQGFGL